MFVSYASWPTLFSRSGGCPGGAGMRWWRRREPEPSCRPDYGPDGEVRFVWTVSDGRGIVHPHGEDGCPFDYDPELRVAAEEVAAESAGVPCPDCGMVHHP